MLDSEDEDEEAEAEANELYPYNDINLEELLAPLTSIADLPNHPTLSRPYTSNTLTNLTEHARQMMQREKQTLWKIKGLLTKLGGDHAWMPTAMFETPEDLSYFSDGREEYRQYLAEKNKLLEIEDPVTAGTVASETEKNQSSNNETSDDITEAAAPKDTDMSDAPKITGDATTNGDTNPVVESVENAAKEQPEVDGTAKSVIPDVTDKPSDAQTEENKAPEKPEEPKHEEQEEDPDTTLVDPDAPPSDGPEPPQENANADADKPDEQELAAPSPKRMRTRGQVQAAAATETSTNRRSRSPSASDNTSFIHPYFLAPPSSYPIPNLCIPSLEADETRRMLQLYVQKQEEVVRGVERLFMGLLKADRMRKEVWEWAVAEGHRGEMSDGEDYFDCEAWGVDPAVGLKKGADEEGEVEEDKQAKKTRGRRQ
jgi:hypothetical protein